MSSSVVISAKELFAAGKYEECKSAVEAALESSDDAGVQKELKLLLRKCNTHLLPTVPISTCSASEGSTQVATEQQPQQPPTDSRIPAAASSAANPPRFEWFQTPTTVTLTFYVKNRAEGDVAVTATERAVEVVIRLDMDGREYQHAVEKLFALVQTPPQVSVRPMKVEVTLTKQKAFHWPTLFLQNDDDVVATIEQPEAVAAASAPGTSKELKYPNSKGRNWADFKIDEEEEKPEGDAALNALFKQIYGNGSDEQRKAMIKSFTESNGTVLSTNWDEVGSKKVVGEAPRGMEAKPYNE